LKALLVQVDEPKDFPNLSLMKLSAIFKKKGDEADLHVSDPDKVFVSVIFSKNYSQAKGIQGLYPRAEIFIGGPGAGGGSLEALYPGIDDIMPDYDLYGIDYSMGFTSRGCIRKCPFCFVPSLEGEIRAGTPIEAFHNSDHKKIILLDNNLLASPTRDKTLQYLEDNNLRVNFSQGLDIRLVDRQIAEQLRRIRCFNWRFRAHALYFAWDLPGYEKEVLKGIEILLDAKVPRDYLMFYILVGYNTGLDFDYYRVRTLLDMDIDPYVMVYNDRHDIPILQKLKRWSNRHTLCKSFPFSEYKALTPRQRMMAKEAEKSFHSSGGSEIN